MHPLWQIPELLIEIVSFLSADDISHLFHVSRHLRTTLRANLPPQLCPLPDGPPRKRPVANQTLPQDVCDIAKKYIATVESTPKQLKFEDAHYWWREDAQCQILDTLLPHLHPVLKKYSTRLLDGYDALAEGKMNVCLKTEIPYQALYELVHGKKNSSTDYGKMLAVVAPKAVTVFCLSGVSWDLLYSNVKYRLCGDSKYFSVRVEREKGVRMVGMVDELKGTLIVDGMSGGLGQDVVLFWALDDCVNG